MAKTPTTDQAEDTTAPRTAKQTLIVLAIMLALWLCYILRTLLVDAIIAMTLASAILPLAKAAEKHRIPRPLTVLLTYLAVAAFYAATGYMLWAPIKEQALLLATHLPDMLASVMQWYDNQVLGLGVNFEVSQSDFRNFGQMALNRTLDVSQGVIGVILNAVLVLFLTAYFVVHSHDIWKSLLPWLPTNMREKIAPLIGPVGNRMGGYVRGQALVSTAVACFFAIGLSLIGVKYALILGLVAGIMNLVPYVGSFITTLLALVIAANQSPVLALLTFGLFVIEQAVESNFIVPFLLGKQVELEPLVVLFAILIGATLGGAVGALIAVPITTALLLLARELYQKPMLQKEGVAIGDE